MRATGMKSRTALRPSGSDGRGRLAVGIAEIAHRAVAVAEAAARQADLPEQRGERERGPHRLFAVLRALQRVRHGDERALRGHLARQRAQVVGGDSGVAAAPTRRILATPSCSPQHVGDEAIGAVTAALEERRVVQSFADEHVRQAEHHRDVAQRRKRIPARLRFGHHVVAQRREVRDLHAATTRRVEMPRKPWRAMPPGATKVFFSGRPPNATSSSVCRAMTSHDVALRNTAAELPTRCGSSTSDAPML